MLLPDTQISILGNDGCGEIHHRAYRGGFAQIAVNHEPDVARKARNALVDADEVAVSLPEKARQAGHAHAGPHGDQVLADMVQFAGHRTAAGNAEQPYLLRHVGEARIERDELKSFGRG